MATGVVTFGARNAAQLDQVLNFNTFIPVYLYKYFSFLLQNEYNLLLDDAVEFQKLDHVPGDLSEEVLYSKAEIKALSIKEVRLNSFL